MNNILREGWTLERVDPAVHVLVFGWSWSNQTMTSLLGCLLTVFVETKHAPHTSMHTITVSTVMACEGRLGVFTRIGFIFDLFDSTPGKKNLGAGIGGKGENRSMDLYRPIVIYHSFEIPFRAKTGGGVGGWFACSRADDLRHRKAQHGRFQKLEAESTTRQDRTGQDRTENENQAGLSAAWYVIV